MFHRKQVISLAVFAAAVFSHNAAAADDTVASALGGGTVFANLNLRYEGVTQNNALRDAGAHTLRTRLGYRTADFRGFSALLELEDSRIVAGQDEFTVGPTGFRPGEYSVVADPETTELDQGFVQYKTRDGAFTAKLGRQVIALGSQRFVGHVGWRQDRQTFDAATIRYGGIDKLTLDYGFVNKRNRIFAEQADLDARDHLLSATYTSPIGLVTGYAYLLEVDNATRNGLDTYGFRLAGKRVLQGRTVLYALDVATQDASTGANQFDAGYLLAEAGVVLPIATVKLGYELLGSDGGNFGFSTPLATLHKFNGWADQFLATPAQGLADLYVTLKGQYHKFNWQLAYHDFSADEASATIDDLGNEIDLQVTRKFADHYTVGAKYAAYSAGDAAAGKVDTDKLWVWFTVGF